MDYLAFLVFIGSCFGAARTAILSSHDLSAFRHNGVNVSSHDSSHWLFQHNGIPKHNYGPFPSNHNPNSVKTQNNQYTIPKTPTKAASPMCLPMGPIGVAISGIPFFNPYSAEGYDAVGGVDGTGQCAEVFDSCQGHPQMQGIYHYHQLPKCLYKGTANELLGVALDGNPIYGPKIENGVTVTRKSGILDACGGRYHNGHYRYHITTDFPYILGCYHSRVHIRHHPRLQRRDISQVHDPFNHPWQHPNNPHHNCQRPTGGPQSWLPCYANCENPILGCHNQTSAIVG